MQLVTRASRRIRMTIPGFPFTVHGNSDWVGESSFISIAFVRTGKVVIVSIVSFEFSRSSPTLDFEVFIENIRVRMSSWGVSRIVWHRIVDMYDRSSRD